MTESSKRESATAQSPAIEPRWRRIVCCSLALIAVIVAGILGVTKLTEPGNPYDPQHEPKAKRFDHVSLTNGSDVVVHLQRIVARDENDVVCFQYQTPPEPSITIEAGRSMSFLFDEGLDFGVTHVEVQAEADGKEMTCDLQVTPEWNINAAKFWLANRLTVPVERGLVGEALLCHDDGTTRTVIPHGEPGD